MSLALTNLIIAKDNSKQISFFLHGSSCASCVLGKSSYIITNIAKEFSDYSVRFIHTTKDTSLINKTKKLLPSSIEYISGEKANLLMTLFAGQNFSYFLVLQDSCLNTLRLTNLDTTYSFLKDKIKTFFSSKEKYTLTKLGDYNVGYLLNIKSYKDNVFFLTVSNEAYYVDRNGNATNLPYYADTLVRSQVLPKTFLNEIRDYEASGISAFYPSTILEVNDSSVTFLNLFIDTILYKQTMKSTDTLITTITPKYNINSLTYNYTNGSMNLSTLPEACRFLLFNRSYIYKNGNSYIFNKRIDSIDLTIDNLQNIPLVYFTDTNFIVKDSISLYDISRTANVNSINNCVHYSPLLGTNQHLLYEISNGMYMIIDSSKVINVNKATSFLLRYSSKDFFNRIFNLSSFKLKQIKSVTPVTLNNTIYLFSKAVFKDKDILLLSMYDSNGDFQCEFKINFPEAFSLNYFYPFEFGEGLGVFLKYNDSQQSIYKIKFN